MKKCLIILLCFCALQFCNAQKYFNELIDYNTQQFESLTAVHQLKDSGYIAAGFSVKMGYGYNYFAVQTDKRGTITNKICYQVPYKEISVASPLKAINDSEFVCTGVIIDQDSTTTRYNRDIYLLKLNNIGDTIWTKRLGFGIGTLSNPDFEVGFDVIYTQDNGYAITGYSSNFVGGNVQVCLIKTDSLGNLLWQKSYGGGGTENAYSLIQTPDKGFLLAGYTYSYGNGDRDGYLIKTDSLGNFQWQKTYGGAGNDGLSGLCKTVDGNYLLSGWTKTNFNLLYQSKLWFIKVDNNGNQIWNKTFGGDYGIAEVDRLIQLQDSTCVGIGGISDSSGIPISGLIMKISLNGDSIWAREYKRATTQADYFNGFAATNDGGFIIAGQVPGQATPSGTQDGWLVKVDCLGADSITHYFGNSCYSGSVTGIKEIVIDYDYPNLMDNYPNPFDEITVLPYYLPDKVIAGEIIITDITGRIVQKYNLQNGSKNIVFNSSELGNGIYYYTMIVDGKTISTKKMVILK